MFGMSRMARDRTIVAVSFVLGVALLSTSAVLASSAMNDANTQRTAVTVDLASQSRAAAAQVSREVDSVRLAMLVAARNPSVADVLTQGVHASPATVAAAGLPIQALASVRPGLISVARLRLSSGVEIARIVDQQVTMGGSAAAAKSTGDGNASWITAALQDGPGQAVTSNPHLAPGLGADVVSTAVAVGPQQRPLGVLEVETPVKALASSASGSLGWTQTGLSHLSYSDAMTTLGVNPVIVAAGVVDSGDVTTAWTRTSFDSRLPGAVALGWVITVAADTPVTGLGAIGTVPLVVAVLGLLCLLLAGATTLSIGRRLRQARRDAVAANVLLEERLDEMSSALNRVAAGELGTALPVENFEDGALREMASSFDSTRDRLRDMVEQAQVHGRQLSQASVELQAAAGQQAAAASEQTSVVAETTATIEELAATAKQIAITAESLAHVAGETLMLTEQGRAAVMSSVAAMDVVGERVGTISERAIGLGDTGREIGRILDVIDDLSERTNLLALNAAIEAARAGEHGQGFAVVAAEVRRLAERARQSATQIHALVDRISRESGATVLASEDGQREVDRARAVAHQAAVALDRIADMVDDTTTATREISIATQQQRSASEQVVVAMGQVSDASRQYAVGSRQAASSASELAQLSENIRGTIGVFSTTTEPVPTAPAEVDPQLDVDDGQAERPELVSVS